MAMDGESLLDIHKPLKLPRKKSIVSVFPIVAPFNHFDKQTIQIKMKKMNMGRTTLKITIQCCSNGAHRSFVHGCNFCLLYELSVYVMSKKSINSLRGERTLRIKYSKSLHVVVHKISLTPFGSQSASSRL